MSLSMHQVSIPVFVRGLQALSGLLEKGRSHAAEVGVSEDTLLDAKLAPDMLSLVGQVQRASDTSKLSGQRLSGVASPAMPDTETTFAELIKRVADTVAYLEAIDPAALEGSETRTVELNVGPDRKVSLQGDSYLLTFALPNFFFHVATAHDILRSQGVKIGKMDYLGAAG